MKYPAIDQWRDLYDAAKNIKKEAPWYHLWDSDIIAVLLPERNETVYCSVMGANDECYAIGMYVGEKGLRSYFNLALSDEIGEAQMDAGLSQSCLMCNFGDREEITPKDRETLKELNLRFRGHNDWIFFRKMIPGYAPWYIEADDADIMIQTLQQVVVASKEIRDEQVLVDFEADEILLRKVSPETGEWISEVVPLPVYNFGAYSKFIFNGEDMRKVLSKQKKSSISIEVDSYYVPFPIQEDKNTAPRFPRMISILDKKTGMPKGQDVIDSNDCIGEKVVCALADFIMDFGKPASIEVRNLRTKGYIEDLCEKIGIKSVNIGDMEATDNFVMAMMASMMFGGDIDDMDEF